MIKTRAKKILALISVVLVMCVAFAGCMPTGTTGGTDGATTGGSAATIQMVVSIVILFAVFYFFMIRPEKKRKKQAEEMRSSLGIGDDIVTIGGIMGKIVNVSGDSITFETGEDRVRMEVTKWAVSKKEK